MFSLSLSHSSVLLRNATLYPVKLFTKILKYIPSCPTTREEDFTSRNTRHAIPVKYSWNFIIFIVISLALSSKTLKRNRNTEIFWSRVTSFQSFSSFPLSSIVGFSAFLYMANFILVTLGWLVDLSIFAFKSYSTFWLVPPSSCLLHDPITHLVEKKINRPTWNLKKIQTSTEIRPEFDESKKHGCLKILISGHRLSRMEGRQSKIWRYGR